MMNPDVIVGQFLRAYADAPPRWLTDLPAWVVQAPRFIPTGPITIDGKPAFNTPGYQLWLAPIAIRSKEKKGRTWVRLSPNDDGTVEVLGDPSDEALSAIDQMTQVLEDRYAALAAQEGTPGD